MWELPPRGRSVKEVPANQCLSEAEMSGGSEGGRRAGGTSFGEDLGDASPFPSKQVIFRV